MRSHTQISIFIRQQDHNLAFEGLCDLFGSVTKKLFEIPRCYQVAAEGVKGGDKTLSLAGALSLPSEQ
ncbi:MAG: hypothetical protein QUS09_04815, partial [Methanotrichaceae archaeon]|nr:hypothetical protein [Methanotrichaceae archaeon]